MTENQTSRLYFKDICNWAGVVTLFRLGIGVSYPILISDWRSALFWLLIGAITDSLDGWVARKFDVVSHTGGFMDGWVDKIFCINVTWTLVLCGYVEWWMGWLFFTREWIQIPLVPYYVRQYMQGLVPKNKPFWAGKIASFFLFVGLSGGICDLHWLTLICSVFSAVLGLWTALIYFEREFAILSSRG